MKSIYVHSQDSTGCTLYRAVLPVKYSADDLLERGIRLELRTHVLDSETPDALMVHRILKAEAVVQIAAKQYRGMKLIHDIDDLIEHIPAWSPVRYDYKDLDLYRAMQVTADMRTCSTEKLQDEIQADRVLPNLVDMELFEGHKPLVPNNRPVQVLWFGSGTHRADLELLEYPILSCLSKYQKQVKFTFWGTSPFGRLAQYIGQGVQFVDMVPLSEFYPRLTAYQPDIVLCPLADHRFNWSKSNIKWLEGAMAGAACIVSPGPTFADVEDGVTGVVASDDEWFDKLRVLIEDEQGRKTIAAQGQECVREDWSWQHSPLKRLWVSAFTGIVETENAATRRD